MRILVADQNALLLAAIARTFGRHCEVVVATRRDVCVAHIEERKCDVVVACEKLRDYTGLELLGEVTALSPQTLRIFSARPETLKRLGPRLDFFGLLGTLSYPIDPRKLLLALKVARGRLAAVPKPPKPKVRHVVLEENEWDTGERLGLLERELEAAAAPSQSRNAVDDSGNTRTKSMASAATSGAGVAMGRRDDGVADTPGGRGESAARATQHSSSAGNTRAGSATGENSARAVAPAGTRAADPSVEVSFEEMPGAIAVARVAPKSTSLSSSVGEARAEEPLAAVQAAAEKSPRRDVKAGSAPKGAGRAGGDLQSFLGKACNDSDIDEPLPVETHGAANEPLFDNAPGKGGVRSSSGAPQHKHAPSESSAHGTAAASDAHGAPGDGTHSSARQPGEASGARATTEGSGTNTARVAGATRDASGTHPVPASRGASDARATPGDGDSGERGRKGSSDAPEMSGSAKVAGGAKNGAAKGPKVRKPTVPTAAQREAFQRALARRNAARRGAGGGFDEGEIGFGVEARDMGGDAGAAGSGAGAQEAADARTRGATADGARTGGAVQSGERSTPFISRQALADLAKMASTKRPLKELIRRGAPLPRRRVLVYGSGVAAALLAVVVFQSLKATPGDHGHNPHAQEANTHLFGPTPSLVPDGTGGPPPQPFAPTPPQAAAPMPAPASVAGLPQPQHFDPNTAPPDPPPPPAVEHPGPMEPPSMAHNGPPLGMRGSADE